MKKTLRYLAGSLAALLGTVILYIVLALLLPFIEVPAKTASGPALVPVYILTNGVHTDLVLPVKNPQADWSTVIPYENTRSKRTDYQYVGIGWGDKGFYLDTPTWAELKFNTAFKAAFWLSESAMHCTFLENVPENEHSRKIMLTESQYTTLVNFVREKFEFDEKGKTILVPTEAVYGDDDAFYEAKGRYSFLNTCNTWTNNGLKVAGQKAALWTATDFGIFQHYPLK